MLRYLSNFKIPDISMEVHQVWILSEDPRMYQKIEIILIGNYLLNNKYKVIIYSNDIFKVIECYSNDNFYKDWNKDNTLVS